MEKTSRKHLLIAISLSVVAFLSAAFALLRVPSKKTGNADWMAALPSDRPLSSLSLPGTHDSGATHSLFDSAGKCQDASIREQLDYGARFLDIRLKGVDDSLSLYHGFIDQRLSFASVLSSCYAFLNAHSSETIVMSVKEEQRPSKCTRGFETLLSEAIAEGKADRWYTENAIPTLGEVRGRIVLLSRYANPTMGFDCGGDSWRDNATFEMDNGVPFHIQDRYKVSDNATKWSEAKGLKVHQLWYWLAKFKHYIVCNVYNIVYRAHSCRREAPLHPQRRRFDFNIGNDTRCVSCA